MLTVRLFAFRLSGMNLPELTIVIPTLNEEDNLPLLLDNLAEQEWLSFEVLITDGGSKDSTCQIAKEYFENGCLSGQVLVGDPGRGQQLNRGAEAAQSKFLLFLHADSKLPEKDQLFVALEYLKAAMKSQSSTQIAGRFSLRFDLPEESYHFGFFYYETKAALNRPGCIHGDQGMLIARSFFEEVGPFREDLPVMEDTALADRILREGEWLLLPGELRTSARRFLAEGLKQRQTLNALMMNFLDIGWLDFFVKAPEVYRVQNKVDTLHLHPFFQLIDHLLKQMPIERRKKLWLATGRYVRSQAWQIGWSLDCRNAFRNGQGHPLQPGPWLKWFDRWFEPATNNRLGNLLTAALVRAWFAVRLMRGRQTRNNQ